ncbi:MAG: type II secretion system protein [Parcubacteria group bacterium]|nr:type II secretion system protein [Parcubacteria group bacterium]
MNKNQYSRKGKGFTLLELLIVVAILAILSAVTVIVLNPAELLRKSRDSQRISDLATIKTALGFWIINTSSPVLSDDDTVNCKDGTDPDVIWTHATLTAPSAAWTIVSGTSQATDGTGWIKINLSALSGGSPIAKFPVDPSNRNPAAGADNDFYYAYACHRGNLTFELDANMESAYYKNGGAGDVESKDGGDWASIYEEGTQLDLLPSAAATGYYQGE